jgi:hypothetical protein
MPRQPTTFQLDLFPSQTDAVMDQMPQWQALPAETRQSLTGLIISLILNHVGSDERAARQQDADHDV